ncbi:MAG: type I DNA topoisomerase [Paludibacteraceae bacterium]|nr:type I DNA topoisomerase [Paludibacteraceae bacterium]
MPKNLVIVESPTKSKTIEKFLGKEYKVLSSYGHIRDLKKTGLGIDVANSYTPIYEIPDDKKEKVKELKKAADAAEVVWLASDEDREGEAIAWHLYDVLGLKDKKTYRIVFHEITKDAILEAIENPREINMNMVDAQQARRVLDRIVGFELSPVLWKKIKTNLSAGRVQSVTVKLVVEREREINNFKSECSYKVVAEFLAGKNAKFRAELKNKIATKEEAEELLERAKNAKFVVSQVETKPLKRHPMPPFTTSTLQQEAARKYGFTVASTMQIAQSLYEHGKITYMRTDSVNLSTLALGASKKEISRLFGENYYNGHQYTTHSKGAQEAHEAIRPTYIDQREIDGTAQEKKLYELIWKRTIASQMTDAEYEKTTVTIEMNNGDEKFVASGEILKFEGYRRLYLETQDEMAEDSTEQSLPKVKEGTELKIDLMTATERYSQKPPRYTEATLIHKLEELGIGRPSTYAPIISTIMKREYVDKREIQNAEKEFACLILRNGEISEGIKVDKATTEKGKLSPTDVGMVVNDYLSENFSDIMDYNFTANVEEQFDKIACGEMTWVENIDMFYGPFHKSVVAASNSTNKAKVGERMIGTDPVSGEPVFVKIGRYGPVAQIGEATDDETKKPRFAPLKQGQTLDTITLEEALELFKLPKNLGEFEGEKMSIGIGKFGPYIRLGNSFISIPKDEDPMSVTRERAEEIIAAKRRADAEKVIARFEEEDITVLHGRFNSIYISCKGDNYRIPKGIKAEDVTLEKCLEIISDNNNKTKKKTKSKK